MSKPCSEEAWLEASERKREMTGNEKGIDDKGGVPVLSNEHDINVLRNVDEQISLRKIHPSTLALLLPRGFATH